MGETQLKLVAGHPDFWEKAFNTNPRAFEAVNSLVPLSCELVMRPGRSPLEITMQRILAVIMDSSGAVVNLCFNGYGADALKLSRTVWDASLTVSYLSLYPAEVNDYLDFVAVEDKKSLDELDALGQCSIPNERRDEINREYLNVRSRFLSRNARHPDDVRGSWCSCSISQMSLKTGRVHDYKTFYGMASGMGHVSVVGLKAQSDNQGDMVYAPNVMHIGTSLLTIHSSILCTMHDYNDTAKLGFDSQLASPSSRIGSLESR